MNIGSEIFKLNDDSINCKLTHSSRNVQYTFVQMLLAPIVRFFRLARSVIHGG